MIIDARRGYEVCARRKGKKVYVRRVYAGVVTWTLDYAHAAHYTKRTAMKHDQNIRNRVYEEV